LSNPGHDEIVMGQQTLLRNLGYCTFDHPICARAMSLYVFILHQKTTNPLSLELLEFEPWKE
jgi:hypothetical protein